MEPDFEDPFDYYDVKQDGSDYCCDFDDDCLYT